VLTRLKKLIIPIAKETETSRDYAWVKELSEQILRYVYYGELESEAIKVLRDNELDNPAPFSNKTLIEYHNFDAWGYESPVDFKEFKGGKYATYMMNVPVIRIIGASTTNNLNHYMSGMTYRDVLFQCLHGGGLDIDSLKFLLSEKNKAEKMPHQRINHDRKTRSEGELTLYRFGDFFISSHGHQRTILAMYWIWQNEGANGMLKNVKVTERFPNFDTQS
jgi:hypothetical protein